MSTIFIVFRLRRCHEVYNTQYLDPEEGLHLQVIGFDEVGSLMQYEALEGR